MNEWSAGWHVNVKGVIIVTIARRQRRCRTQTCEKSQWLFMVFYRAIPPHQNLNCTVDLSAVMSGRLFSKTPGLEKSKAQDGTGEPERKETQWRTTTWKFGDGHVEPFQGCQEKTSERRHKQGCGIWETTRELSDKVYRGSGFIVLQIASARITRSTEKNPCKVPPQTSLTLAFLPSLHFCKKPLDMSSGVCSKYFETKVQAGPLFYVPEAGPVQSAA